VTKSETESETSLRETESRTRSVIESERQIKSESEMP